MLVEMLLRAEPWSAYTIHTHTIESVNVSIGVRNGQTLDVGPFFLVVDIGNIEKQAPIKIIESIAVNDRHHISTAQRAC